MPMLEVVYADEQPLDTERKVLFAREAESIFHEVLGTPPGRAQLIFQYVAPENTINVLRTRIGEHKQ